MFRILIEYYRPFLEIEVEANISKSNKIKYLFIDVQQSISHKHHLFCNPHQVSQTVTNYKSTFLTNSGPLPIPLELRFDYLKFKSRREC